MTSEPIFVIEERGLVGHRYIWEPTDGVFFLDKERAEEELGEFQRFWGHDDETSRVAEYKRVEL